jgi:ubiquinone/menaquinone biosynthesis C-methylase UbiE
MCRYLNENGHITGLDISENMERQFNLKFKKEKGLNLKTNALIYRLI